MSFNKNKRKKYKTKLIFNSVNKFNCHSMIESEDNIYNLNQKEDTPYNQKGLNNASNSKINNLNSKNYNNNDKYNYDSDSEKKQGIKDIYFPEDINSNINIDEEIYQSDKNKSPNHEIISSCINNCIIWTLKANINNKKANKKDFKSNYVFKGKNIFFPILEFSVLNAFNNSLCFDKCFPMHKNYFDNKKKILEKLKQESLRQLKESNLNKNEFNNDSKSLDNASLKNILESCYPIDNNKSNFNIIDNNLCLKDNLNNVFLLKFDLKNNIDKNIDFRLIDNNCVGREIDFALNGEFHGNHIFKNDLKFSVTYRDFIKTIQFRLDNFKSKILDYKYNKKYGENNKNHNFIIQEQSQKIFYGKMINNVNIGIEFLKPQSFDKLQTNFNSIVNSEIELTKIFIELTIPKILINKNNNNFVKINNEKNEINMKHELKKVELFITPKKEEERNNNIKESMLYIPPPPPFIPSYIPPPPAPPASWANLNFFNMRLDSKGIPLPPPFPNFNNLLYKNDYTSDSSSIRNKLVYNKKLPNVTFDYLSMNHKDHKSPSLSLDPINAYSSPTSGNYSPMSTSYLMMKSMPYLGGMMNHHSISMNSPFNMSNYSSPYIKDNLNFPHLNLNTRKNSESFTRELFDNLMDKNSKIFNSNQQTPNISNKNGEEPIPLLNLQQCMTSTSMEGQQNSLNDTDISSNGNQHSKIFPMTIKQRIMESYKKNNKEIKEKKEGNDNEYNNKNILRELRDSFIMANQGKTNLEIFLESVSPLYKKNTETPFLKLKLIDIFNKFKKISLFGLKNIYCFYGELIHLSYTLSLSSISIKIINKTIMNDIILELKKKYPVLEKYNQLKNGEEITINILQFIIYFSPEYIQISYSENIPSHLRNPFIKTIFDLSIIFPYFNQITIEDINLIDSLFSILYSPLKCSKPYINYTSFVVYYQFTKEIIKEEKINKNNLEYDKQTITGVLPLKINTNLYFQRIIIYNFVMNTSPLFNYFSPYFNNDTIMIKNMVYSVINDVSKHIRGTSYDYEYFMKLSKQNSINQWK